LKLCTQACRDKPCGELIRECIDVVTRAKGAIDSASQD
jgi:hypothetical protein